jgi:hypothetical protein
VNVQADEEDKSASSSHFTAIDKNVEEADKENVEDEEENVNVDEEEEEKDTNVEADADVDDIHEAEPTVTRT